jgi:hypothetical protein
MGDRWDLLPALNGDISRDPLFYDPFFILFLNLPTAEWQFSARTEK